MASTTGRTPLGGARRDRDRSRDALLDAARAEFAAKGLAGARVQDIAVRAGVNKQLISYYFGGKQGLYDAIIESWHAQEEELARPDLAFADVVAGYLRAGVAQRELQRLFVRESIDEDISEVAFEPDAPELVDLRRRQAAGEIAADLDPAFLLVALQGTVTAGVVFGRDVKRYLGVDPTSPEFLALAEDQLRRILGRLA